MLGASLALIYHLEREHKIKNANKNCPAIPKPTPKNTSEITERLTSVAAVPNSGQFKGENENEKFEVMKTPIPTNTKVFSNVIRADRRKESEEKMEDLRQQLPKIKESSAEHLTPKASNRKRK